MIRSYYRCCCIKEPAIFSHCVHFKLGCRFHALLKVCSDRDDIVTFSASRLIFFLTHFLLHMLFLHCFVLFYKNLNLFRYRYSIGHSKIAKCLNCNVKVNLM